jgi:Ca-activated chloride channel family protein
MSWLDPGAALWLLLVPALVALYMLRPRAQRRPVSSLRLWQKLPQVERPRARLRRPPLSLLLILQALLLAAGATALARPATEAPAGRHLVILLDASGSMQTVENGSTRFEQAKAEVKRIAGTRSQDRVTLLRAGSNVSTVCSMCDQSQVQRALADLRPGAGRANWQAALGVASGLAGAGASGPKSNQNPGSEGSTISPTVDSGLGTANFTLNTEVYIVSDGAFDPLPAGGLPPSLHFVQAGTVGKNRAITALSARRPPNGSPEYAAYARVDNMGDYASVEISALADTIPLQTHRVDLPAGGHADVTWKVPTGAAKLTVSISPRDALAADDQAVLVLPADGQYRVPVISAQSDLYIRALAGIPGLDPVATELTATGSLTSAQETAFTIIEGTSGAGLLDPLPAGNLLLVNPGPKPGQTRLGSPGLPLGSATGSMAQVSPLAVEADHPLLSGLDFAPLLVNSARVISPSTWLVPLLEAQGGTFTGAAAAPRSLPLLLAGERDGRRVVVLTFDPRDSNLPKLAAFPLLMANMVDWLYPLAGAQSLSPGEQVPVAPGSRVTTPDGQSVWVGDTGIFANTDMQGIYWIEGPWSGLGTKTQRTFAVNMIDRQESGNQPRPHPELVRQAPGVAERLIKQEQWSPLAAIALMLVGAEWLLYCWKRGSA